MPIVNELELARNLDELLVDLQAHDDYPARFNSAFPGEPITRTTLARALAQFLRTIVSFGSPFDEINNMEEIDHEAKRRGHELFQRGEGATPDAPMVFCNDCHSSRAGILPTWTGHAPGLFTTNEFKADGLPVTTDDLGRYEATTDPSHRGAFKVPPFRTLSYTAPYMHDGRFATLREVLEHYNEHVQDAPTTSREMYDADTLRQLKLTPEQIDDIIAFMTTLDDPGLLTNPDWSDPFAP